MRLALTVAAFFVLLSVGIAFADPAGTPRARSTRLDVNGSAITPASVTSSTVNSATITVGAVLSSAVVDAGYVITRGAAPGGLASGSVPVIAGSRSSSYAGIWFGETEVGVTQNNANLMGDNNDMFISAPNLNSTGNIYLRIGTTAKGLITSIGFNTLDAKSETFGSWSSNTVGVVATGTSFLGGFTPTSAVSFRNVTCSWAVAGVGGTVGVVLRVRNITDGSTLCTCTLGACTATAAVPLTCDCNATATAGKKYTVQYDPTASTGTDCTTDPSGTFCTVEMTQ